MTLEKLNLSRTDATRLEQCETHGEFVSRNLFGSLWSRCPVCEAKRNAVAKADAEAHAAAERRREWEKRLGVAGIPERFHDRTLKSYIVSNDGQRHALKFACDYARQFDVLLPQGRNAIFSGRPGNGKTHLGVGIGLHAMAKNRLVLFTTVQRMIRRVKDSWNKDSTESESEVMRLFVQPDFLILDEIGVQFGTDFEKNLMFDVLNERYEKGLATLLISNLPKEELTPVIGERVIDRFRENGGQIVPFFWESFRGKC